MYDDALIMVLLCLTIAAFYSTYALYINFVISFIVLISILEVL